MRRKTRYALSKRKLFIPIITIIAVVSVAALANQLQSNSIVSGAFSSEDLETELFPTEGFKTKIILGDTIPKLVESGAIDLEKLKQIYGDQMTEDKLKLLTEPDNEPLTITMENANFLLTILWPLGISNKNPVLNEVAQYSGAANLASTGGWTLGKEDAMVYFNSLELIRLSPQQQAVLEEIAASTYRPCCDNPTAFPDCNHGAALLALLELGASQNLSKDELYKLALQANTLWFPQQYLSTAVYLKSKSIDYWSSAKGIMGYDYSSISGWIGNVYEPLQEQGLLPKEEGGTSCAV